MPEMEVTKATEEPRLDDDMEQEEEKSGKNDKEEDWVDVLGSGQLKMKVIRRGEPHTRPQPADICDVKLTGKLENGLVVEEFSCLQVQVGESELIQGLDLIIPLMDIGDHVLAEVGPRFAYGTIGLPPNIPPNAVIHYEIELINVNEEPHLETIPHEKRKEMANAKRSRGNWWYVRQDPTKAIQCYRRAIEILDDTVALVGDDGKTIETPEKTFQEFTQEKLVIYNNLAAAQLQIQAYDTALTSVDHVLQCEPDNVKALFRKGKILVSQGKFEEAVEFLKEAFQLEPENNAIKKELNLCVKKLQKDKEHQKNLYKKMLGTTEARDISKPEPHAKYTSWTKILTSAATAALLTAIAVGVGYKYKSVSLF